MRKVDIRKLFSFYLDCLEEEDLRGLSFNTTQVNRSFILGTGGSFLLEGNDAEFSSVKDSYFWRSQEAGLEPERLYLGYPILINEKAVSPLFFLEVDVQRSEDGHCSLRVADNSCFLNHHLFGKRIQDIEGPASLQEELECDLSFLRESLSKASEYLDVCLEKSPILSQEELSDLDGRDLHWAGNFMLFRGGRSAFNAMLRRDIDTFLKYPKFIDDIEGTALEVILGGNLPDKIFLDTASKFSTLNQDQQRALRASLSQRLTVVTGPPGTGKSQVVANILAVCALNKKSVLFASKNNKAVDVVYEKLHLTLDKDNWLLRMGNAEKVQQCQDRILAQLGTSRELSSLPAGLNEALLEVEQNLAEISKQRSKLEEQQTLLSAYEARIRFLEANLGSSWMSQAIESLSWDRNDQRTESDINRRHQQLLSLSGRQPLRLWLRLIAALFPRKLKDHYINYIESAAHSYLRDDSETSSLMQRVESFPSICEIYDKFSCLLKLKYLRGEKDRVEKSLARVPSALEIKSWESKETERQVHLYQQKLRFSWTAEIEAKRPKLFALCRRYFSAVQIPPKDRAGWQRFTRDFLSLLDYFHVWIVTNLSTRKSIPLEAKAFDFVVIDEASQCDILSALPLLYRAKSAIIIGDPKQLKHVSLINNKKEREIAERHGVGNLLSDWSYRNKSIYDVAESKLLDSGKQPELLSFHYRCHPQIIGFSNGALYGDRLSTQTDIRHLQNKFREAELGVFWHDVKGSVPPTSNSACNMEEVGRIVSLIEEWRPSLEAQSVSVGIVTPFSKQVEKLKAAIEAKKSKWGETFTSSIVIGTAHRFQGDECDLIIFSPVVARGIKPYSAKWVASTDELLNVAITRARGAFHVVGDMTSCQEAGFLLRELALYIRDSNRREGSQPVYESTAEEIVGGILSSLGLPFFTQVEKGSYRLDFVVSTPFGNKINLEVDGRQHYTPEHVERDQIRDRHITDLGYKVVRVNARDTFTRREILEKRLSHLV